MIEFALCFPLLLTMGIGVVDFGSYLQTQNNLLTIARDGARYASLNVTAAAFTNACTTGPDATGGCSASDQTVEGIMQLEGWSLTLGHGGVNLQNQSCSWTGTSPNQQVAPPSPPSSCITIAVYPASASTAPTWSPSTAACAYANCGLSAGRLPNSSWLLVPCGYWSPSADQFVPATNYTLTTCDTPGALVMVTIAATYSPLTPVLSSVVALQPTARASYAMAVAV
jgi:Flp pilus assembly protein TadG